ncbi:MAG: GldG family protein [Bacteriovoracia bacterium]
MNRWWYSLWVIAEGLLLLSTMTLWLVAPEHLVLNLSVTVFTILLGGILFYPRRVGVVTWLKSRQGRASFIQLTQFFLVCCITGLVTFLAWKFPFQVDMTERSLNTLSDQSQKIIEQLPADTKMTLYARRAEWTRAMALLRLFRDVRRDIVLEAIDPETRPQAARAAGVNDHGTVVVEGGGKRISFALQDELSVTNALLKIIRERQTRAYFISAHGEATCDNIREEGLSAFCAHLKSQNFIALPLDLQRSAEIPLDADVVIIWGPVAGILPQEIQRLQRWLEKGGSLLFAYSPNFQQDHQKDLRALLVKWGIQSFNDLVIDRLSTLESNEATIPVISKYSANHPITRGFHSRTIFPLSSSLEAVLPLYQNVAVTTLAQTSDYPGSWAERDLAAISQGKANFDEKLDKKGPIGVAMVAERITENTKEKDTRVAVIGNDVFIRNAYQNQTANMNFVLNIMSWLAHEEGLLTLNRPGLTHEPVILSTPHLRFVFVVTVLSIPLIAFILAVLVYRRRRRL